jgi:hypothetical protein
MLKRKTQHRKRIEIRISRTAELCCLCLAVSSPEKDPLCRCEDRLAASLWPGALRALERTYCSDPSGRFIARINGTHSLVRAGRMPSRDPEEPNRTVP